MNDPFAAIRVRFVERTRADLAVLEAEPADSPAVREVIHRLTGTAGTLGFDALSALAAPVDIALHEGRTPAADDMAALKAALAAMHG